jgi:ABC-type cobalamin/Fe3+-siderophores transport system ATPase subunit
MQPMLEQFIKGLVAPFSLCNNRPRTRNPRAGRTVLLVEQNAHMALSIGDRGYVLETGRLVAEGNPAALWNNDELPRRVYRRPGNGKVRDDARSQIFPLSQ